MKETSAPYMSLDLGIIAQKKGKIVSSAEALKDVEPIEWEKDILDGKKRVVAVPMEDGGMHREM